MSTASVRTIEAHRLVQATVGAPLGSDVARRRPVGRIGGIVGCAETTALTQLAKALGPGRFIGDFDCCWLDGRLVASEEDWLRLLDAGRLGEVEGAFAIAWRVENRLYLARDAIGERSLFYAALPEGVVFASTVRALLATGLVQRRLHLPGVVSYLTYAYLPGRETLVEGVHELLPGERIEIRDGQIYRSAFWSLPPEPREWADEETLRKELRHRLEEAVRRRLPSGEPVGVFLSGGLDSSLVVALARQLRDAPIHTYSVSFGPEHANELPFSSLVAEHCRTTHRIVEVSPAAVLRYLDESIALLSDPIGDPLTVPNALLFREASSEVGVVLNGEGGDPCFGGPKNLPMLLAELYDAPVDEGRTRERAYLRAHQKCYDDLGAMLTPDVAARLADLALEDRLTGHFRDPRWRGFVSKLQAINVTFKGGHHILPKVEAESAPFGVLPRSPLFDRAVVELSFAIPPQLKLRGSVEKYLLKQAVRDLLPPVILDRPKSGMLVPVEGWFRGPLKAHARERLMDGLASYRLFRPDYLERLLDGRLGGHRPRHGAKIWLLLTLEAWLRTVFVG